MPIKSELRFISYAMMDSKASTSTIGKFSLAVASALEAEGVDPLPLFAAVGENLDDARSPEYRIPIATLRKIWQAGVEQTGNTALGLRVAEHIRPSSFHALGYALWASETLESALIRNARYQNLISDALKLSVERSNSFLEVVVENNDPIRAWEGLDCSVAWMVVFCRALSEPTFGPKKLTMARPKPRELDQFLTFFGCPITFDSLENRIVFRLSDVRKSLPGGNSELAENSVKLVENYLAKRNKADIAAQVYSRLVELLPAGQSSQNAVAEHLNMTVRNLQRKLHGNNTSFSYILEKVRRELADHYIREPHFSITDITYLLGFSDTSSFARAFKQWHALSPSQYRDDIQRLTR
jgi:AraC-like DNA-binding protein